ncbi:MAG: STAS/SEC14 domain-containing protein [Nitrosomonas sp.]|nr:STAS/SEC14 domain-containing protein [Nitrosomonas sp.]
MISIDKDSHLITIAIAGEFTLEDFRQFEDEVLYQAHLSGKVNILLDLRDMLSYTVDVAWGELVFVREHGNEIRRVAVVTDNQWQAWSAWISNLLTEAEVMVFYDYDEANKWATA